ncbi:MAG: hypothetical protein C0467_14140 [Planctomycetaceae bacterium]|nr:hypothetical protein [Planctomycetaceae bacterium]
MTAQEQITLTGIIISACVGFGGLMFAAFTQWLAYKNRTATYQGKLYDEQMKLYPEFLTMISKCTDASLRCCLFFGSDNRKDYTELSDELNRVKNRLEQCEHVLCDDVIKSLCNFKLCVFEILSCKEFSEYDEDALMKMHYEVSESRYNVIKAIRKHTGVDRLSDETIKLIGSHREAKQRVKPQQSS